MSACNKLGGSTARRAGDVVITGADASVDAVECELVIFSVLPHQRVAADGTARGDAAKRFLLSPTEARQMEGVAAQRHKSRRRNVATIVTVVDVVRIVEK